MQQNNFTNVFLFFFIDLSSDEYFLEDNSGR